MLERDRTPSHLRATVLLTCVALFALLVCVAPTARANNGGIDGYSGAGDDFDGTGDTCTDCHDDPGFYSPVVSIDGPTEVVAGSTNDYTIELVNLLIPNPFRGGFNLAISDGELDSDDGGVEIDNGELTHDLGRLFGGGSSISWDFEWSAPEETGEYTMYIAAIAGNGLMGNNGDNQATSRFEVNVVAPSFLRGDVDANGEVAAITDALALLDWGFLDGDEPLCLDAADTDDDGLLTPSVDAIYLLMWGVGAGDAPPQPGPDVCGQESEDDLDEVGCAEQTCDP